MIQECTLEGTVSDRRPKRGRMDHFNKEDSFSKCNFEYKQVY